MKKVLIIISLAMLTLVFMQACDQGEQAEDKKESKMEKGRPVVIMETDMGTIKLELFPEVAPNHVMNFLHLIDEQYYNGLTFHRVIKNFVIQSGCPKGDGTGNAGWIIDAEFNQALHNPGTLAMARGNDPNSASSQFYICLAQLPSLDHKYTVFGQTIEGMDVVNKIGKVKTDKNDTPVEPVRIIRMWKEGNAPPVGEGYSGE